MKFMNNRTNLTIIQCIGYFLLGYALSPVLTLKQQFIVFGIIVLIHIITHIKAVADGMLYRQIMLDNDWKVNGLIDKIKKESKKIKEEKEL